jgi:hypothetical protein
VPTLIFGSETWILRKKDEKSIEAQQIKFLRPLVGASGREQLHNAVIREQLG